MVSEVLVADQLKLFILFYKTCRPPEQCLFAFFSVYMELKARFHETTKPVDETTLIGRLEANDQKFDLCHRLVSLADQYTFIFPLKCGQQLDTDRPIEIDLFGRSERLVWATKQSSDRPTNNIRYVKYFAQKPRQPIDLLVSLDIQGSSSGVKKTYCRPIVL